MTDAAEDRLRQVTARRRERAASLPEIEAVGTEPSSEPDPASDTKTACEAHPPRHWSEVEREHDVAPAPAPARTSLSLEMGDQRARGTARARLRRLLSDGREHGSEEMVDAGGLRFGARLLELRRGLDGGVPLDVEVERRPQAGRFVWFYRVAPPGARLPPSGRFA